MSTLPKEDFQYLLGLRGFIGLYQVSQRRAERPQWCGQQNPLQQPPKTPKVLRRVIQGAQNAIIRRCIRSQ
jgi:hypothetical protein